ncbi:MAG: alpha-amylase family glycosyl hydrolase [Bacteroidota bacterium]
MKLNDPAVIQILKAAPSTIVTSNGNRIPYPFPSPADWRDHWIYFLLVDRFNNPCRYAPNLPLIPAIATRAEILAGIRQQLPYLKQLGAGAIWLSPVLINPQWFGDYWGGYGTFDFMRIEPKILQQPRCSHAGCIHR